MSKVFISRSSKDDGFVRELRESLAYHDQDAWIDSRELRGGDPLWPEIQAAIESALAYVVVVSPDSLQSRWVGKQHQNHNPDGRLCLAVTEALLAGTGAATAPSPIIPT
ncbi:MAG TPA: toll/interleukin-1 receptor domain-containing protein [Thermoanaerobaculia bacterium]